MRHTSARLHIMWALPDALHSFGPAQIGVRTDRSRDSSASRSRRMPSENPWAFFLATARSACCRTRAADKRRTR
ncbi:hypothetical protein ABK046_51975, partial [Streptomyces caeruleatus]